jgi:hypothetical protein
MTGRPEGVYWIVRGILLSFAAGIFGAWVLLVEIQRYAVLHLPPTVGMTQPGTPYAVRASRPSEGNNFSSLS